MQILRKDTEKRENIPLCVQMFPTRNTAALKSVIKQFLTVNKADTGNLIA